MRNKVINMLTPVYLSVS